jgi:hypothetical protein
MCGIAGFTVAPGDLGRLDTRAMTAVLAYEMMSRGKDATGVLTIDPKGRTKLRKKPYKAEVFIASRAGIGKNAQSALIHTRAATQGSPDDPRNNHPIKHGKITGIHNGVLYNDDALFDHYKWDRLGKVDSEAAFAALNYLERDEALKNIDGSWAIAWVDESDDARKVWLARGSSSPLHYAMTKNGSVVFASTRDAVKEAFEWGGVTGDPHIEMAPEGFLAHTDPVNGGLIVLDKFDGSGKDAIGHRPAKAWQSYGGWDGAEEWENAHWTRNNKTTTPSAPSTPSTPYTNGIPISQLCSGPLQPGDRPTVYKRYCVTGDFWNPKPGDRQKYIDASNHWHTETCIDGGGGRSTARWSLLIGETPKDEPRQLQLTSALAELPGTADVFDDDVDDEFCYGNADVGDMICIAKDFFDGGPGHLAGEVLRISADGKDLTVQFRAAVISRDAFYSIAYSPKGAINA